MENYLFDDILIAPEPISNKKPIVKTIKNINATENPNIETWYKVTAIGNKSKISRSKIKNKPLLK